MTFARAFPDAHATAQSPVSRNGTLGRPSRRRWAAIAGGVGLAAVFSVLVPTGPIPTADATPVPRVISSRPPPAGGYFPTLIAPGDVSALPRSGACARAVHRSTWEPRPDNDGANHVLVDPTSVHNSFASRPRSSSGSYDSRWDSWLLPRVNGQFSGTTDEIIQWAACKWGLPDNYLRAEADTESTWFQYETYPSGRCVDTYGCGDWFNSEPYAAHRS